MQKEKLIGPQYKSYKRMFAVCFNAALSAFSVGYSLVYASFLTAQQFKMAIIKDYGFNSWGWSSDSSYNSVVQGSIPVGAIFGALLSSQVIRFFSRKNSFLFTNLVSVIAMLILALVKNPYVFVIARFTQGMCTGIYSALVPLYINQILTPDCLNLGSLNQILISFAQFFCCALSFALKYIFSSTNDPYNSALIIWKVILLFPLLTIVVQTVIFVFVFSHETPKYLFEKGQAQKGRHLLDQIYHQDYVQAAFERYNRQTVISHEGSASAEPRLTNSWMAIFFSIHIALLQQMSGVNAIAVYGKSTLQEALEGQQIIQMLATLGLYLVSVIAAVISISLMNKRGRKYLIQLGTLVCTICLGVVAVAFFFKKALKFSESVPQSISIIIGMCVFMAFFGLTLGPIVWLYVPQIVEPNIIPFSTMTNLLGAAICIIGFPLIAGDNPNIKFVPFLFFFIWSLVSLLINQKIMVETWNKPKAKVIEEYNSKKLC